MGIVSIKEVSFSYLGNPKEYVISNINLDIKDGEGILLCGKSGCGKTTISKLVNGLIPHFEAGNMTGEVLLEGANTKDMPMYKISLKVASVFQNPKTQFFNIDPEDEIVFSLENQGVNTELVEERLKNTVEELNIGSLLSKNLFEMSGGEKQIIAFACAYAEDPDILVLDEPSSNLDLWATQIVREILLKLKKKGKTIIIAEHRVAYLKGIIDTAIYVNNGKIQEIYSSAQFYSLGEEKRKEMGLRQVNEENKIVLKTADNVKEKRAAAHSLELDRVQISFGKNIILKNVSFKLYSGDIVALVGKNGVGKTSLCRTICGFIESKYGEIKIDNKPLKKPQRLKKSYIVMQDVNCQLFAESVLEECKLGNPKLSEDKCKEILKQLGLGEKLENHPQSLSGGQKQRLAIAVAITAEKNIIILDEPTSGLDYSSMLEVSKLIKELAERGFIIIVITHDMEFLENTCNRCLQLTKEGVEEKGKYNLW